MDVDDDVPADELSAWLDGPDPPPQQSRRRRSWLLLGGAGAAVIALAALFSCSASGPSAPTAAPGPTATLVPLPIATAAVTAMPAPSMPPGSPIGAAAVVRLREGLAALAGSAEHVWLDLATVEAVEELADTVAVRVVATVLRGGAEGYSSAAVERWVVPLNRDGTPAGTPWPVAPPTSEEPTLAPPEGLEGAEDVRTAVLAAGYADVEVLASAPHPAEVGVLVGAVRAVPPGGNASAEVVVWVQQHSRRLVGGPP